MATNEATAWTRLNIGDNGIGDDGGDGGKWNVDSPKRGVPTSFKSWLTRSALPERLLTFSWTNGQQQILVWELRWTVAEPSSSLDSGGILNLLESPKLPPFGRAASEFSA